MFFKKHGFICSTGKYLPTLKKKKKKKMIILIKNCANVFFKNNNLSFIAALVIKNSQDFRQK